MSNKIIRRIGKIFAFTTKLIVLVSFLISQLCITEIFLYQNRINDKSIRIAKADYSNPYPAWGGRDTYTVSNHPGATYQAKINEAWKAGIKSDFSDIRFSDGDGNIIPYWIESKTDGVTAAVWVKLTVSTTVNLHYGNAAATSESNGDNVFDFFDGAESGTISSKWTVQNGSWTNSTYSASFPKTDAKSIKISSVSGEIQDIWHQFTSGNQTAEFSFYDDGDTDLHQVFVARLNGLYVVQAGIWTGCSSTYYCKFVGSWSATSIARSVGWHDVKIVTNNNSTTAYIDGTQFVVYASAINLIFLNSGYSTSVGTSYYDNVRIRKYAATDPTFSLQSTSLYTAWTGKDVYMVSNNPGAGYQALINIPWKAGIKNDFSDIRFSDNAGNIIPYWVESKTDGATAVVWVKLTASNMLNLHYGKADAASESNIDNVMEFGDDFNRANGVPGAKWWTSNNTAAISGSKLSLPWNIFNGSIEQTSLSGERVVTFNLYSNGGRAGINCATVSSGATGNLLILGIGTVENLMNGGAPNTTDGGAGQQPVTSGAKITLKILSTRIQLWIDSTYVGYYNTSLVSGYVGFYSRSEGHGWSIDNLYARKYSPIEPSLVLDDNVTTISAGSDQNKKTSFTQTATATDSGSGINASSYVWSKVSGPGTITFGSANALSTTISASQDGTYVIGFTAQDNAGNSATDSFTLVWDTNAPQIAGVSEGGIYNTDRTITFNEGTATLNCSNFNSGAVVSAEGSYTLIVTDVATNPTTIHFTIDKTGPVPFVLISPASGSRVDVMAPTFSWNASSDAVAGLEKYQLYIDGVMDKDGITTTNTSPSAELSCGDHTWQVKALDTLGNFTDSGTFAFSINCGTGYIPPTKPDVSKVSVNNAGGKLKIGNLPQGISQIAASITEDFSGVSWEYFENMESILGRYVNAVKLYLKFRGKDGGVSNTLIYENKAGTGSVILSDGDIVKTINNPDVYIIKYKNHKQFKRLILSPSVFKSYGHLKWSNLKIISQVQMNSYNTSALVQVAGDSNLYELFPSGDTGERKTTVTGKTYDADSVYEINRMDRDSYKLVK